MNLRRWYWEEDLYLLIAFTAALIGLLMQVLIEIGGALLALWLLVGWEEGDG